MPENQGSMPLLRSFASFFPWFYRHAAPTVLWLGYRSTRVFQQAVSSLLKNQFERRRRALFIELSRNEGVAP